MINIIKKGIATIIIVFLITPNITQAEYANYLVISEIVHTKSVSDDEFVEIYNPTNQNINLNTLGLKLHVRNSLGDDTNKNINWINQTIPAYGYFLFVSSASTTYLANADATYSADLVNHGAVYISTNSNVLVNVIDFIAWGSNPVPIGYANQLTANFNSGQSIERKSNPNGIIENQGNAWDSNNNDFLAQNNPNPQNSHNLPEFCPQTNSDQVAVSAYIEPALIFKLIPLPNANWGVLSTQMAITKTVANIEIGTNALLGSTIMLQTTPLQGISTNHVIDHTGVNPNEIFQISSQVNSDGLGLASTNCETNVNDIEAVSNDRLIYNNNGAENFAEDVYDVQVAVKMKASNLTPVDNYFTTLIFTVNANF